jgi:hypothetical protein
MGEVVQMPKKPPDVRAVTCGCGGQTFILVTGEADTPDFVYCADCQYKLGTIQWSWVTP